MDLSPKTIRSKLEDSPLANMLWEKSTVAMLFVGMEGKVLAANPACCKLLMYTEYELVGMHFAEFTADDDIKLSTETAAQLFEGKTDMVIIRKKYRQKGGRIIYADAIGTVVTDGLVYSQILLVDPFVPDSLSKEQKFAVIAQELGSWVLHVWGTYWKRILWMLATFFGTLFGISEIVSKMSG